MLRHAGLSLSKKSPQGDFFDKLNHNESHHPHIHLIVYSSDPSEGYLTKQGVAQIRSSVAGEIFAQDLQSAYEKQTAYRNKLRGGSRKLITDVIARIHTGGYDNPEMEQLLTEIADRLHHTSGKLVYGYLPKGTKGLIDKAVDLLAADERITKLYDLWYEQKEEILRTYNKKLPRDMRRVYGYLLNRRFIERDVITFFARPEDAL